MLPFYSLDFTNLIIIVVTSLITFKLLDNKEEKNNKIFIALLSLIVGTLLSFTYSYLTLESDTILTSNFWD